MAHRDVVKCDARLMVVPVQEVSDIGSNGRHPGYIRFERLVPPSARILAGTVHRKTSSKCDISPNRDVLHRAMISAMPVR